MSEYLMRQTLFIGSRVYACHTIKKIYMLCIYVSYIICVHTFIHIIHIIVRINTIWWERKIWHKINILFCKLCNKIELNYFNIYFVGMNGKIGTSILAAVQCLSISSDYDVCCIMLYVCILQTCIIIYAICMLNVSDVSSHT